MTSLELKIPPPLVAAICAAAMWGVSLFTSPISLPVIIGIFLSIAFAVVGVGFSVAGFVSFRRAKTTVNPTKPETASSLVSTGVYSITRNPMYVGLLLVLVAWAIYLSSPWSLAGPLAFFLYISRFQIAPEERALSTLFGNEYENYRARVRRWL